MKVDIDRLKDLKARLAEMERTFEELSAGVTRDVTKVAQDTRYEYSEYNVRAACDAVLSVSNKIRFANENITQRLQAKIRGLDQAIEVYINSEKQDRKGSSIIGNLFKEITAFLGQTNVSPSTRSSILNIDKYKIVKKIDQVVDYITKSIDSIMEEGFEDFNAFVDAGFTAIEDKLDIDKTNPIYSLIKNEIQEKIGFAEGAAEEIVDMVVGILALVVKYNPGVSLIRLEHYIKDIRTNPDKYIMQAIGLGNTIAEIVSHPKEVGAYIFNEMENFSREMEEDPYKRGQFQGHMALFIASLFIGGAEAKVLSKAGKAEEAASIANKVRAAIEESRKAREASKIGEFLEKSREIEKKTIKGVSEVIEGTSKAIEGTSNTVKVPQKAYDVADDVLRNNGAPPKGYKGGRVFQNDARAGGQKLPDGVKYKEYDINPYIKGQNRGPERIVIGDDGSVWYTSDHYNTFTRIK